MKINKFAIFLILILATLPLSSGVGPKPSSSEKNTSTQIESWTPWTDIVRSFNILIEASYKQFSQPSSMVLGAIGAVGLAYTLEEDKRLMLHFENNGPRNYEKRISNDWSIVTNFPGIPLTSYLVSWKIKDSKLKNFSMEYFASMYLAMSEASLISLFPIHDRPATDQLSSWETSFRGDSSFPSGHMLGMSTLFFKTLQYYGPIWAIAPGAATYIIARERMASNKHYPSDIWGGLVLSALASEGTKIANDNNSSRHPVYKWIFEHEVSLMVYPTSDKTLLSFNMTY